MKQFALILAAFLFVHLFVTACDGSLKSTEDPLKSTTKIQIGVDATLPPFEMDGSQPDEVIGFDVDVINAIAERAGLDIELVKVGYNQVLPFVATCELDGGISAIPVMDAQTQQVDFSDPYFTTGQSVVVKKGNKTLLGQDQLAGMKVGTQTGTLSEIELAKIASIQAQIYENYQLAIQELAGGYIDAVIADQPRAQSFVNIKRNDVKIVGDTFGQVDYAIVTCKTQPELLKKINASLAEVKADGTLDRLAKKWKLSTNP